MSGINQDMILQMKKIVKTYPGVKALGGVDLTLRRGTIHALMGENGAGKSTLMKILAGIERPDSGDIVINGESVVIHNVRDAIAKGISMIHQELSPVMEMSIAANIFLGRETTRFGIVNEKDIHRETAQLMKQVGIAVDPGTKMKRLSVAHMQMVEIVKAISNNADIIIMDEPTSALTNTEVTRLFSIIDTLKKQNKAIIYISHKMDEIFQIADEITVLRDGELIGTKLASELNDATLIKMMVGRELNEVYPKESVPIGETILEVKNLTKKDKFDDISFTLRRGEILGFAGLVGSGRTEIVEAIFGFKPADSGEILIGGKPVVIKSPNHGIRNKIAFVSEDRKMVGLNLISSIKDNITLANLKKYCDAGFVINHSKERRSAQHFSAEFNVKAASVDVKVQTLSGGNQQKVVLAKWISCDPDIIIMDEPTRGIDVGAKAEIYKMMCALARKGNAIIMVSSEMPELLGMSDRINVLSQGTLTGTFDRNEFDQESIMACASGKPKKH